jgi:hypothetical protein
LRLRSDCFHSIALEPILTDPITSMTSSQNTSVDMPMPVENPSTPQPLGVDLPSRLDLPMANSPSTSMMVAGSSSIIHSPSITPPPSSQIPSSKRRASTRRSTTPETSVLSSPPPTIANGTKRDVVGPSTKGRPNDSQIATASNDKLREMLARALEENNILEIVAGEARMSAAHYKLQHNLLTIESENALKRMEVEHDITRREVQVLQSNGRDSSPFEYTQQLKAWCKKVEDENNGLKRRLNKAKKLIEQRDDELADAKESISRLHDRIRQNREHINELRSPGGPLHVSTPKTAPATPHQPLYRATPRYTPNTNRSVRYVREHVPENNFNALLLAGAVLSQENNSAPSTPIVARHALPRTPNRHNRAVQSLSSLPNTPGSGRPATSNSALLPSAQFSPEADARVANALNHHVHTLQHARERRRKSRDSTISASDADEIARSSYQREDSEEIQESQASQNATEMLRLDPRESFEVAASRTHTPTPAEQGTLQQARIFGSVTKRKREEEIVAMKKARFDGEGVGLGIGFETRI